MYLAFLDSGVLPVSGFCCRVQRKARQSVVLHRACDSWRFVDFDSYLRGCEPGTSCHVSVRFEADQKEEANCGILFFSSKLSPTRYLQTSIQDPNCGERECWIVGESSNASPRGRHVFDKTNKWNFILFPVLTE